MPDTMLPTPPHVVVRQPGEAPSYWQPVPANGFVRCLLDHATTSASTPFAMGTQTVDPGCHVREHVHDPNEEVIFVLSGAGEARVGEACHAMVPGTIFFFPPGRAHAFHNTGEAPLTFLWLMLPGGLETFFARIGRERQEGDAPPAPFPRPADVLTIEAETVFGTMPPKAG